MTREQRRVLFLAAEAAARLGLDDADFFFGQVEEFHQSLVDVVGALHRAAHGDPAFGARLGDDAVGLDVELLLRARAVLALDDDHFVRVPNLFDVPLLDEEGLEDVVFAPDDCFGRESFLDVEDAGQRLYLDADGAARLFEQILVRVREQEDGLFGVVDERLGKVGLVVEDERDVVRAGDVARRDDGELFPRDAFAESDARDAAARGGAAHGHAVEHPGEREVVHVTRRARHLRAPLLAGDWLADVFVRSH